MKKLTTKQKDEIIKHMYHALHIKNEDRFKVWLNANTEEKCDHVWDVPRVVCDKCRVVYGEHKPQHPCPECRVEMLSAWTPRNFAKGGAYQWICDNPFCELIDG